MADDKSTLRNSSGFHDQAPVLIALAVVLADRARAAGHEDVAIDATLCSEAINRWLDVYEKDPVQRARDVAEWHRVQAQAVAKGIQWP